MKISWDQNKADIICILHVSAPDRFVATFDLADLQSSANKNNPALLTFLIIFWGRKAEHKAICCLLSAVCCHLTEVENFPFHKEIQFNIPSQHEPKTIFVSHYSYTVSPKPCAGQCLQLRPDKPRERLLSLPRIISSTATLEVEEKLTSQRATFYFASIEI